MGGADINDSVHAHKGKAFRPGDIVWAKLSTFPWWPAIVYLHPQRGQYLKDCVVRNGVCVRGDIHVQFFDQPPSRAWIKLASVAAFEGSDHLQAKKGGKYYSPQSAWLTAVRRAEAAFALWPEDRLNKYAVCDAPSSDDEDEFDEHVDTPTKKKTVGRKRKASEDARLEVSFDDSSSGTGEEASEIEDITTANGLTRDATLITSVKTTKSTPKIVVSLKETEPQLTSATNMFVCVLCAAKSNSEDGLRSHLTEKHIPSVAAASSSTNVLAHKFAQLLFALTKYDNDQTLLDAFENSLGDNLATKKGRGNASLSLQDFIEVASPSPSPTSDHQLPVPYLRSNTAGTVAPITSTGSSAVSIDQKKQKVASTGSSAADSSNHMKPQRVHLACLHCDSVMASNVNRHVTNVHKVKHPVEGVDFTKEVGFEQWLTAQYKSRHGPRVVYKCAVCSKTIRGSLLTDHAKEHIGGGKNSGEKGSRKEELRAILIRCYGHMY